jgi:hypothetical protein
MTKESLIFDRTDRDVSDAKEIVFQKVHNFLEIEEKEKAILERGLISVDTINRIESCEFDIFCLVSSLAYFGENIESKSWKIGNIFKSDDFSRLIYNLESLKSRFFSYSSTPSMADAKYDYKEINKIEKALYDLYSIIEYIEENTQECGTFYSGE